MPSLNVCNNADYTIFVVYSLHNYKIHAEQIYIPLHVEIAFQMPVGANASFENMHKKSF